jgi:hypothetical protein
MIGALLEETIIEQAESCLLSDPKQGMMLA